MKLRLLAPLWLATIAAVPCLAADQEVGAYLMDEAEELRMAATAGPQAITAGATYYVLRRSGYERAKVGDNGFHCFVERSWSGPSRDNVRTFDPRVKAPHCINPEGARTTLREIFLVAELAMAGRSREEIESAVDRAYGNGTLTLPNSLSLTYMMSKHQWLGERVGPWQPHVMLWIPYLTKDQVGNIARPTANAMLAGKPGSRRSVLVFPVPEFIE
ncbi:MAG: hypothetical protein AAF657_06215 [Acidobacteriota bacterium]